MAVRNGTLIIGEAGHVNYQWSGILNADSGSVLASYVKASDYAFQVTGTFGASGAVALQGSNDGTNFATLDDVSGTAVSAVASTKIWRVANLPKFLRVLSTAGDGTTTLVATLVGILR